MWPELFADLWRKSKSMVESMGNIVYDGTRFSSLLLKTRRSGMRRHTYANYATTCKIGQCWWYRNRFGSTLSRLWTTSCVWQMLWIARKKLIIEFQLRVTHWFKFFGPKFYVAKLECETQSHLFRAHLCPSLVIHFFFGFSFWPLFCSFLSKIVRDIW